LDGGGPRNGPAEFFEFLELGLAEPLVVAHQLVVEVVEVGELVSHVLVGQRKGSPVYFFCA